MPMGAVIPMMIPMRLKLRLVELLDQLHIPERGLLNYVFDLSVDVCHGCCADFTYFGLILFSLELNDAAVAKCTCFSLESHKTHTLCDSGVI